MAASSAHPWPGLDQQGLHQRIDAVKRHGAEPARGMNGGDVLGRDIGAQIVRKVIAPRP